MESGVSQGRSEYPTVRYVPVRLPCVSPLPGFPLGHTEFLQSRVLRPCLLPLFPVDLADSSAEPLVRLLHELLHGGETEVVDPS